MITFPVLPTEWMPGGPDVQAAKKDWSEALKIIRREYKKRGEQLFWMRNIEVGTKGAWHIHLAINRIPDTDVILKKAWTKGKVVNQLLYEQGEYKELAAYITKTPRTDNRLRESNYDASRNMPLPEPKEKDLYSTLEDLEQNQNSGRILPGSGQRP